METKHLLSNKENKKRLMESINEVPRDLKREVITDLSNLAKEITIDLLYDTVDNIISQSDVPLVDYDLHSEVMDATILLLMEELQS